MIEVAEPVEVYEKLSENAQSTKLLDVRTVEEFAEVHAENAVNVPLDQLNRDKVREALGLEGEEVVYIICRSGKRSMAACEQLVQEGFTHNVINVEGGTLQWIASELPTKS